MKIGLISAHAHPVALGLRYVSSYLKSMGHEVRVFFMCTRRDTARPDYTPATIDELLTRLCDCELIGVSLLTYDYYRARFLTEALRRLPKRPPIVWGGTHATVAAEECLVEADVVCVGDGEEPMLQLVERMSAGRDPTSIPGLWFRAGGAFGNSEVVRNAPGILETDLDDLPYPDWELDTHWVATRDGLFLAQPANLRGALDTLRISTARGCPYRCTFCNNAAQRMIHGEPAHWVRMRSLENVLGEIRHALASFPAIRAVNFVDDLFLVRSDEELERFAERYNAEVGLPLQLDVFPNTVTERKIGALARVPLELISMGIESASEDTLRHIYQRPTKPARIAQAIGIIAGRRVPAEYHYIIGNPYEPAENVIETMRFVASHHRGPAVLRVFPLMFYPGSPLYARAKADGLLASAGPAAQNITGERALRFMKRDYFGIWLRLVLSLRNAGLPPAVCHRVIDFATNRSVRFFLERPWFVPAVLAAHHLGRRLVRNLLYQPFVRPWTYLAHRRPAAPAGRWRLPPGNRAATRRRAHPEPGGKQSAVVTCAELSA